MTCCKCKQAPPQSEDTWCLACSGWEALGVELCSRWSNPALRVLAEDAVIACVRQVRGLRKLGEDLASAAGSSRAAVASPLAHTTTPKASAPRPPLPRGGQVAKAEPAGSEEESEEEESEESSRGGAAGGGHPIEVEGPGRGTRGGEGPTWKYQRSEGTGRTPREPSHPPPPPVRSEEGENRDHRHHRRTQPSGDRRKGERRSHRGGRKHKRLYRTISNPNVRVHRSVASGFWDQTPSRQGAGAIERRR